MEGTELIIAILGCSAFSALITQVGNYLLEVKKFKEKKEEKQDDLRKEIDDKINAVKEDYMKEIDQLGESMRNENAAIKGGLKLLMLDRIRSIGQSYIKDGEVDFDDRRILKQMHNAYHNDLGGNGDLDTLMAEIDKLPLKV